MDRISFIKSLLKAKEDPHLVGTKSLQEVQRMLEIYEEQFREDFIQATQAS